MEICDCSVNSDEAVSSTNRLKAFILVAFYGPLMSLKTAAIEVVRPISEALVYVLNSGEAFEAFQKYVVFLIALLFTIIGFNFRSSNISPLETHYAIFLLFLVAIFVYGLAYVLIAVQPRDSVYLSKLRFICLVFGTIAIELPASIIISPFWLVMVNLCSVLIIGVMCLYKQIYQFVCLIYGWLLQIFQSAAFQAFFSREREDNDNIV
nr:uncharacterized protein LOC112008202 [Quercus suber]